MILFVLADVIANVFLADLIAIYPVAGVIPLVFKFVISLNSKLADVIAIYVEDGKPHFIYLISGRCYCHGGRWNGHLGWVVFGRCYSHGG